MSSTRPFAGIPFLPLALLILLAPGTGAVAQTVAGTASAAAPSSTWISWEVPFTGDEDRDGWTVIELGLVAGGPFDVTTPRKLPGSPEWRGDTFQGLTPDTDYYLRFTFVDPDGVSGTNPQVVGPVHTLASAPDTVTLGTPTVEARETEIYVSQPISDDANRNSFGTVEIATDPGGPWTERCGDPSQPRLPFHPKRCRLRSLTPGTDYWVRIDIADPDGISGTDPQVLGPITYYGRANLAAGMPITADPGWGCCPNPAQLVDGRIQYQNWFYGFAWTGGTNGYAGGPAGWKQATVDLGSPTTFDRVEMWLHDNNSPPTDWRVETSDDGAAWTEAWSTTQPQCRGAAEPLHGTHWSYPACSQGALFPPVTARYVRYGFDDRTLFGGLHGWAVELEVFAPSPVPTDPTSVASTTHPPATWSTEAEITMEWSGASDASGAGLAGYSVLFDTSPTTLPDESVEIAHTSDPHSTTSAPLADGQSHYFHLRTCDLAGHCTATVHAGPYWIDATDPIDPTTVLSTSHTPGVPSADTQITVQWSGASDTGGAGVTGYSVLFDAAAGTLPDATTEVAHAADPHQVTSTALADGPSHWFHLRTCDGVGNCSATSHLGPFWIDTTHPGVSLVNTVADTGDGVLSQSEESGVPITQLLVSFDEPVVGAGASANFLLLRDGGDGFQTTSCAAGADPGDEVITIDTASYAAGTRTSTLGVHGGVPLYDGAYRLFVCASGSILDAAGNALDGDGDGTGGDDFKRSFALLDTRPTAHPGSDRSIDVDQGIVLGDLPAATGGTAPYTYLWTITPDPGVDLSSATAANPTLSCPVPEVLAAQLVVTDASSLKSPSAAAEITVICPPRRDLFDADFYDTVLLEATELITAEQVVVRFGADVTFKAGHEVVLIEPFQVEIGGVLRILNDPSTDCF